MPYTPPTQTVALPVHSTGRPGHRRSYTAESPGAFAPLGGLPRRRSKTVFHLSHDDDEESGDEDDVLRSMPPIKLKQTSSFNIPFPRTSPTLLSTTALPPTRPNVVRTASQPIILSTGKPLKSSLKASTSSPHIPVSDQTTFSHGHARARSAPSTPFLDPPVHKNVHFPANDLATVRIFNRSAKPANISRPPGEETETETEGEQSTGNSGFIRTTPASALPFPRSPLSQDKYVRYEVDNSASSAIPAINPSSTGNVFLESLTFDCHPTHKIPPGLSGSLLVRNIAYEKQVAVRFTLDDWQTTSEVTARHHISLPVLPTSFVEKKQLSYPHIAALPPPPAFTSSPQWDRFVFHIKLEDYALKLADRTMYLVIRYNSNGPSGNLESWDNNGGTNYKVAFRETVVAPTPTPTVAPRGRVFAVSSPPAFAPSTKTSPAHTTSPQHAAMVAQTTMLRLKKLSLRNYAAPSTSTSEVAVQGRNSRQHSVEMEMEMEGGYPAHVKVEEPKEVNEDDMKTPVMTKPALIDSGSKIPTITTTSSSPPESSSSSSSSTSNASTPHTDTSPHLSTIVPSSTWHSSNHPPISIGVGMRFDPSRPEALSPLGLEMGTSPPFSMLSHLGVDVGGVNKKIGNRNGISSPPLSNCSSSSVSSLDTTDNSTSSSSSSSSSSGSSGTATGTATGSGTGPGTSHPQSLSPSLSPSTSQSHSHSQSHSPVYWPWGLGKDGKERSDEEVKMVLKGIREKSTSSPVRKVSPTFGVGDGRISPVKSVAGRTSPLKGQLRSSVVGVHGTEGSDSGSNVASPQPRMPNWSKVGSGWNRNLNGNGVQKEKLTTTVLSPIPSVDFSASKSPSRSLSPTSTSSNSTPTFTPKPTTVTSTTSIPTPTMITTKLTTSTSTPTPTVRPKLSTTTTMPSSFTSGLATPPYSPTATTFAPSSSSTSSSAFFPPTPNTLPTASSPSSSSSSSSKANGKTKPFTVTLSPPPSSSPISPPPQSSTTISPSRSPIPVPLLPVPVPVPGSNHGDSVYQAFVKQWCFAQGPGPITSSSPMGSTTLGGLGRFGVVGNGNGSGSNDVVGNGNVGTNGNANGTPGKDGVGPGIGPLVA